MSRQVVTQRGGAPQKIDLKKLPPGHMKFHGGRNKLSLYIAHGHPYDGGGNLLPADIGWLRKNNYVITDSIKEALAQHQASLAPQVKNCIKCSSEIPQGHKFCGVCGTPQELWVPGSGDEDGDRLAALIDPEDPMSALDTLNAPPPPPRETPDQIFQRLTADEAAKASRELSVITSGLDGAVGSGETSFSANKFGEIEVVKEEKPKKKGR